MRFHLLAYELATLLLTPVSSCGTWATICVANLVESYLIIASLSLAQGDSSRV